MLQASPQSPLPCLWQMCPQDGASRALIAVLDNLTATCHRTVLLESRSAHHKTRVSCNITLHAFCRTTIVHGSTTVWGMGTTRHFYYSLCVSFSIMLAVQQQQARCKCAMGTAWQVQTLYTAKTGCGSSFTNFWLLQSICYVAVICTPCV